MTRFCSIFNQLLQLFPRPEFQKAVSDDPGGTARAGVHLLGPICRDAVRPARARAFAARDLWRLGQLRGQVGASGRAAPRRSTLAYANAHRPWALYQAVFYQVLARCREVAAPKPFRFKNKLLSLDATVIDLCAEMFPWAVFRRTKGAVKLHFTLDHDGYLPTFLVITDGKHHEGTDGAGSRRFSAEHDLGLRQGVHRLRLVRGADRPGVLRDATEAECRLHTYVERREPPQHRGIIWRSRSFGLGR